MHENKGIQDIQEEIIKNNLANEILSNVSMKNHTSWKIGGEADFFCIPSTVENLVRIINFAIKNQIKFHVIGNGSNIWVPDEGIRGLVVKISGTLDKIEYFDKMIKAGSGILLPVLVKKSIHLGLSGLEFAAHIPGTLGGAIINNASFGSESIADVVDKVILLDYSKKVMIREMTRKNIHFLYRGIDLGFEKYIILASSLRLSSIDPEQIMAKIKHYYKKRKNSQPIQLLTAGCIFKNPKEEAAGFLIEKAGAKGMMIGDAQVSELHGNFIINRGHATSRDIMRLIEKVENMVEKVFGIKLEREINIIQ